MVFVCTWTIENDLYVKNQRRDHLEERDAATGYSHRLHSVKGRRVSGWPTVETQCAWGLYCDNFVTELNLAVQVQLTANTMCLHGSDEHFSAERLVDCWKSLITLLHSLNSGHNNVLYCLTSGRGRSTFAPHELECSWCSTLVFGDSPLNKIKGIMAIFRNKLILNFCLLKDQCAQIVSIWTLELSYILLKLLRLMKCDEVGL